MSKKPAGKSVASRPWQKLVERVQSLLVFALPCAMAAIIVLGRELYPEWMDSYVWYMTPIALAAVTLFAYSLLQTSRRLQAQKEDNQRLTELQEQYGVAENLGRTGAWVLNLRDNSFHWSAGCFEVFGIDRASSKNKAPSHRAFSICIHPEDQQMWQDAHRHGLKSGKEIRLDYRYIKDGSQVIWVRSVSRAEMDADGSPVRLAGVVQDITQMRQMAGELEASEAKYRALTELSADWDWEMDAELRIRSISGRIGQTPLASWARSLQGRHFWDAEIFRRQHDAWAALHERLGAHEDFEEFRFSFVADGARIFTVELSGRAIKDADGRLQGYAGIGRDITTEAHQQLILQLESDISTVMQEHDDMSTVLQGIIRKLCEVMDWRGGAHLERIPGTQSITVRESHGDAEILTMFNQLPKQIPVAANSVEARAWEGLGGVLPTPNHNPAFAERYQMVPLKVPSAFIAPLLDEKKKVLSALLFFPRNRLVPDKLLNDLMRTLSQAMSQYIQRKRVEEKLRRASQHDALTGLPNRMYLAEQLDRRLSRQQPVAVLYIDLDRYKAINDTLGHQAGDQVLVEVSQRFRTTIGAGNIASRVGGDEFILLLDNLSDRARVEEIARKVLAAVERPFILAGRAHFLSASIGVALAPEHGTDASTLIKCADNAMYTVKSEGRNDVRFFSKGLKTERTSTHAQLANDLPLAMERGEVELYYQPVISATDLQICGIEGLIRWRHPIQGLLLPEQFLPTTEQSNLMRQVGIWAIRRALDDRIALGLQEFPEMVVSVNISPTQLNEEGFLGQLSSLLRERNFPPRLLRLELTENTLIEGSSRTITLLSALGRLGVQVMIDNFGTGYASLSYLSNLPVSGLKIDQSFIHGLPAQRGHAAITQAIMTLASKLELQVIAEGVEKPEELQALRGYGCRMMQGNGICPPLPLQKLGAYLHKKQAARRSPASTQEAVRQG